ncbi:sugar transferase [Collinsella tanakaei]|nr:sugar transferase [Collinsella tanakaei]
MADDVMRRAAAVAARDDDASIELGDLTGGQSEAFCCHGAMRAHAAEAEGYDSEVVAAAERLSRRYAYRFVKRAFDIAFSLMVLICFWWLFAVIAVAVKLDDPEGPVLFRQKRVTRDGREFTMYKFRSMFADAEERLAELKALNEKTGPVFKMRDDPRVTRVGRLLRRVSLDELPQFVNVLKGDLSVVGPRPALPSEVAEYTPYQRQRLLVKQGITCYWQTRKNRDSITFEEWVDLDLLYIKKCSLWTDIKLIIQTVGCVLTFQGE